MISLLLPSLMVFLLLLVLVCFCGRGFTVFSDFVYVASFSLFFQASVAAVFPVTYFSSFSDISVFLWFYIFHWFWCVFAVMVFLCFLVFNLFLISHMVSIFICFGGNMLLLPLLSLIFLCFLISHALGVFLWGSFLWVFWFCACCFFCCVFLGVYNCYFCCCFLCVYWCSLYCCLIFYLVFLLWFLILVCCGNISSYVFCFCIYFWSFCVFEGWDLVAGFCSIPCIFQLIEVAP